MVIRGFHTELEAVYEEYNIGIAQDNRKLWESMSKMLFPTHPYGTQTTIGTQEHLKNPSITNIKNYFDKWYRPNNVAICMAGDMDPDQVSLAIGKGGCNIKLASKLVGYDIDVYRTGDEGCDTPELFLCAPCVFRTDVPDH